MGIRWLTVSSVPLLGGEGDEITSFQLHQNYPNPFYPETTIRFDLPEAQQLQIHLYSVTGQHVALLEDAHFEAGRHAIRASVPHLARGGSSFRVVCSKFTASGIVCT